MTLTPEHVAPPLQPHLSSQRLANLGVNTADFDVKGIEGQKCATLWSGDEQRGGITRKVVRTDELGAKACRLSLRRRQTHGTAINAAATRRLSPIMML